MILLTRSSKRSSPSPVFRISRVSESPRCATATWENTVAFCSSPEDEREGDLYFQSKTSSTELIFVIFRLSLCANHNGLYQMRNFDT